MRLIYCPFTESKWYQQVENSYPDSHSTPVGVLWHDVGGTVGSFHGGKVSRHVNVSSNEPFTDQLLEIIGSAVNSDTFNRATKSSSVHAFIGKLADGSVGVVQTGPLSFVCWGAGPSKDLYALEKHNVNGWYEDASGFHMGQHWVQFEMEVYIEDADYNSNKYGTNISAADIELFNSFYVAAVEYSAYICKLYNINPNSMVQFGSKSVPAITCHADAHKYKVAGNHGDIFPYFKQFPKFRGMKDDQVMAEIKKDIQTVLTNATFKKRPDNAIDFSDGVTYSNSSVSTYHLIFQSVDPSGQSNNRPTVYADMGNAFGGTSANAQSSDDDDNGGVVAAGSGADYFSPSGAFKQSEIDSLSATAQKFVNDFSIKKLASYPIYGPNGASTGTYANVMLFDSSGTLTAKPRLDWYHLIVGYMNQLCKNNDKERKLLTFLKAILAITTTEGAHGTDENHSNYSVTNNCFGILTQRNGNMTRVHGGPLPFVSATNTNKLWTSPTYAPQDTKRYARGYDNIRASVRNFIDFMCQDMYYKGHDGGESGYRTGWKDVPDGDNIKFLDCPALLTYAGESQSKETWKSILTNGIESACNSNKLDINFVMNSSVEHLLAQKISGGAVISGGSGNGTSGGDSSDESDEYSLSSIGHIPIVQCELDNSITLRANYIRVQPKSSNADSDSGKRKVTLPQKLGSQYAGKITSINKKNVQIENFDGIFSSVIVQCGNTYYEIIVDPIDPPPPQYKVSYINHNNTEKVFTVEEGESLPSYATKPVYQGHKFTGWKTQSGKTPQDFTTVTEDIDFIAQFTPLMYTITYELKYKEPGKDTYTTISHGTCKRPYNHRLQPSEFPEPLNISGNQFGGWTSGRSNSNYWDSDDFRIVKSNITITGYYIPCYKVIFRGKNNRTIVSYTVPEGTRSSEINIPTQEQYNEEGYLFNGWENVKGSLTDSDNNYIDIKQEIIIKATYIKKYYTVVVKDWDGKLLSHNYVPAGGSFTVSTPKRTGYEFVRWSVPLTNIQEDTFATAEYTPKWYIVRFYDSNNRVVSTQRLRVGESATPPTNVRKVGHIFRGWSGNYQHISAENANIYPIWNTRPKHVQFIDSDGTVISSQDVVSGNYATRPADIIPPVDSTKKFVGWKDCSNNIVYSSNDLIPAITSDKTFEATYEEKIFTVKFFDFPFTIKDYIVFYVKHTESGFSLYSDKNCSSKLDDNDIENVIKTINNIHTSKFHYRGEDYSSNLWVGGDFSLTTFNYNENGDSNKLEEDELMTWLNQLRQDQVLYHVYNEAWDASTSQFMLTFRANKEANSPILASMYVQKGGSVTPPSPPEIPNYTFSRWSQSLDNIQYDTFVYPIYKREYNTVDIGSLLEDSFYPREELIVNGASTGAYNVVLQYPTTCSVQPANSGIYIKDELSLNVIVSPYLFDEEDESTLKISFKCPKELLRNDSFGKVIVSSNDNCTFNNMYPSVTYGKISSDDPLRLADVTITFPTFSPTDQSKVCSFEILFPFVPKNIGTFYILDFRCSFTHSTGTTYTFKATNKHINFDHGSSPSRCNNAWSISPVEKFRDVGHSLFIILGS